MWYWIFRITSLLFYTAVIIGGVAVWFGGVSVQHNLNNLVYALAFDFFAYREKHGY